MRRTRVAAVVAVTAAAVGLVVGCSGAGSGGSGGPTRDAPTLPPGVETLQTLIDEPAATPALTVGDEVVTEGVDLTRYAVSYPSGDLTITGLLAVPESDGPHPALVVLHGYERTSYDPERSMASYYGPLVEAGYVVLFPDLRNYGGSGRDAAAWDDLNMGGTRDVAGAVRALAVSGLPSVDPGRIGLVGLSEGGRLALTTSVVVPDLLDAVVAMSPMSADAWDNVQRYMTAGLDPTNGFLGRGTPDTQPDYWAGVNPVTFADRTSAPLLVLQAGADETCDPAWAKAAADAWQAAGRDATLLTIDGASHVYEGQVDEVMTQVLEFLDTYLS